jgi:hypothetical protein
MYGIYTEYISPGVTKTHIAHRWLWTQANGLIPEEMELHHKCQNHVCVNLDHLELLTRKEHDDRHMKAKCKNGHELNDQTRYRKKDGSVHGCKICRREAFLRWKAKK